MCMAFFSKEYKYCDTVHLMYKRNSQSKDN